MAIAYNTSIVRDGLVLHLDAANVKSYPGSANTWFDLSTNKNNGTLVNSPVYSNLNGGYIVFNGANNYITTNLTASQLGITTDFTISIFTNRAASPTNALQGQAGFGTGASASIKNSSYYFADIISSTPTRYTIPFTPPVNGIAPYENVWVNLCVTVGGNTAITYFNGSVLNTQAMDNNIKSFTSDTFGLGNGYGYYRLQGNISLASVYNRALSSTEIKQNFEAIRGRYGI